MHNKTFRLFISSTFSDFKGERELMQTRVFPDLERYCAAYGFQFQAIDLRWGVNEEAQLDQKTIEICLNEVHNCKHYPHPNFLIMLGNRYGWIPLPYAIEKLEFEHILSYYSNDEEAKTFLTKWYQHDENHIVNEHSTAYVINPREGEFVEYDRWAKEEKLLQQHLQKAAATLDSITDKNKYFVSATEHEVIEGISSYRKQLDGLSESSDKNKANSFPDLEYIYGFIREIDPKHDLPHESYFFDSANEMLKQFKERLEKTLEKEKLLKLNTSLETSEQVDKKYLEAFGDWILSHLKASVTKQIDRINRGSIAEKAKSEHFNFKQKRINVFVGREGTLKTIQDYILGPSSLPLVVYGKSGMGKSSLMAKAIDNVQIKDTQKLIYRFVGATEKSSNIRNLLLSIIRETDPNIIDELENIFDDEAFNERVLKSLSEVKEKTVIFIDALDQLIEKTYLTWLPNKLPSNLRFVISVLEDELYESDSTYLDLLKVKFNEEENQRNFIQLKPLEAKDGEEIISKLLDGEKRNITSPQMNYVLKKFEASGNSPLYLTIAFEEIKKWKSFSSSFHKSLENNVVDSIKAFIHNLSSSYHHQQLLVQRSLGYIECSKNGLSEKEILDLLSRDSEVMEMIENQFHQNLSGKIPIAPWARLFSQLSPFLIEKMSDNVSLISQFHRQFQNAVRTEIIKSPEIKKNHHLNLASYFKSQPLVTSNGVYNLRKLSEQAYQLYHSEQVDDLLELFEQDYIRIKHEQGKLYECLYEIEQAYMLINKIKDGNKEYSNKLFSSILKFFHGYSHKNAGLFDFELIHTYFVYRKRSDFYKEFLFNVADEQRIKQSFSDETHVRDYYLLFLSGLVGMLRRKAELKEAAVYIHKIIRAYQIKLETDKDTAIINKQLSMTYYELGYVSYLTGGFENADAAFQHSINYAKTINNIIGEWITKCVKARVAFMGEMISIDQFDNTLDEAYAVFKTLESSNHVAKRWLMVTRHHKFETSFIRKDLKKLTAYFNFLRTNEWNQEYDVTMDLYEAQVAMVKGNFNDSIQFFKKYLQRFSESEILKEEAVAEVFYNMGQAYWENGDPKLAEASWRKALSLGDEPGNHVFKSRSKKKLEGLNH